MGFFDFLFGESKKVAVSQSTAVNRVSTYEFPDIEVSNYIDYGAFSKFRELSENRREQYRAYDEMTKDIVISSALEMYADDASQYDNTGKLIWCTSDNKELNEYVDDLIDTLQIPKHLWSIYYSLALYGDVYIRLFKKESDSLNEDTDLLDENDLDEEHEKVLEAGVDYENHIEICDNPEDIFDLTKDGKTCQYALVNKEFVNKNASKSERIELYPPDQFVHIMTIRPNMRDRQTFEFKVKDNETGEWELCKYKVKRGKSMLHDIYAVEKEIQLLENTILLNRLSRSAITRLVSVEVGDMSKQDTRDLLRRVKSSLESKLAISKDTGIASYNNPGQIDNIVVSPVRNGKGSISSQNIGGDVDIKSLMDLDYFNDKRFGGLKIPKAFLGFEEAIGANSGGTLTRMDSRYGRSVKRLQNSVVAGITDLVNLYLYRRGKTEWVGEFTIRVVSPTTVEDADRDEVMMTRLNIIATVLQTVMDIEGVDRNALARHLFTNYLDDPGLTEILKKKVKEPVEDETEDEY